MNPRQSALGSYWRPHAPRPVAVLATRIFTTRLLDYCPLISLFHNTGKIGFRRWIVHGCRPPAPMGSLASLAPWKLGPRRRPHGRAVCGQLADAARGVCGVATGHDPGVLRCDPYISLLDRQQPALRKTDKGNTYISDTDKGDTYIS